MATVDAEKKLQERVLRWLKEDLGYIYKGNLEAIDNTPIKEEWLRDNLKRRGYTDEVIKTAIRELVNCVNNQSGDLLQINDDVYTLLRYGRQGVKDANGSRPTVHYIEWDPKKIADNDFFVVEEVSVLRYDNKTRKRPDVVIYINGIALGIFELKSSYVSTGEGIRQMLQNQKKENILNFFAPAQLLFAGNEAEGLKYGTVFTAEKYYLKWKEDENAKDALSLEIKKLQEGVNNRLRDGVISLCHKERFLSIIHDFVIFDAGKKKLARHNQYFANIAARERIKANEGGIIWNTQGSGKSLIMVWLTKSYVVLSTLQMVPVLKKRSEVIMNAQRARGVETEGNLLVRAKVFVPTLVPLVLSAIQGTEERALTLEARGFSVETKSTHLYDIEERSVDKIMTAVTAVLFVLIVIGRILL